MKPLIITLSLVLLVLVSVTGLFGIAKVIHLFLVVRREELEGPPRKELDPADK